jgi:hypothetical protein
VRPCLKGKDKEKESRQIFSSVSKKRCNKRNETEGAESRTLKH